ncbi:fibronectin isoform X1 [Rhipicephalus microplus]|uniref:fibronectin isoform X1 n=1 Tax=Rhipicephalus microplus TaxID=6941 RepID=UPI003F6C0FBA
MAYRWCLIQLVLLFVIAAGNSHDNETTTHTISTGHAEALEEIKTDPPFEKVPEIFRDFKYNVIKGIVLDLKLDAPDDLTTVYSYTLICKQDGTGQQHEFKGEAPARHITLSLQQPLATFECSITASTSKDGDVPINGSSIPFTVTTGEINPPNDVKLLESTSTSLTYSWSTVTPLNSWKVSAEPLGNDNCDLNGDTNGHGEIKNMTVVHNITDLTPGSEYNVSIRNCFDSFCGLPAFITGVTDFPGPVTGLKTSFVNGTVLNASWDTPEGCWGYDGYTVICRDPNTGQKLSLTAGSEPHFLLPLRKPKEKFECSIQPFVLNSAGQRRNAATLEFQVSTEGLYPPKDVEIIEHTDTSLTLEWYVDRDSTTWKLTADRISPSGIEHDATQDSGKNGAEMITHKVTSLVPWTRYNFSIVNCHDNYCSEPVGLIAATDVAAPSKPGSLHCVVENDVNVRFTWEKPEKPNGPVEGYSLRVHNLDTEETRSFSVPGNTTSIILNLTQEFNRFTAYLKAYNVAQRNGENVYSPESEVAFETLGEGPMPSRPKAVNVTDHGAKLSWEWPQDPRHHITRFTVTVDGQQTVQTTEPQLTLDKLAAWKPYKIGVASCVNETYCGQKGTLLVHTDIGAPSEPLNLTVDSWGTHWILARWEEPNVLNGPLSGYNVSFRADATHFKATTTHLSYNYTGAVPGTVYEVTVYAFNEAKGVTKHGPAASLIISRRDDPLSMASLTTTRILLASLGAVTLGLVVVCVVLHRKCPVTSTFYSTVIEHEREHPREGRRNKLVHT